TWRALEAKAAEESCMFAAAQHTRQQWETLTESSRRIALAADRELRHRYPEARIDPLCPHPAECEQLIQPAPLRRPDEWVQPTLDEAGPPPDHRRERRHAIDSQSDSTDQVCRALGLTAETADDEIPRQVRQIHQNARLIQAR